MQRWPQQNHEGEAGKNNTKKEERDTNTRVAIMANEPRHAVGLRNEHFTSCEF